MSYTITHMDFLCLPVLRWGAKCICQLQAGRPDVSEKETGQERWPQHQLLCQVPHLRKGSLQCSLVLLCSLLVYCLFVCLFCLFVFCCWAFGGFCLGFVVVVLVIAFLSMSCLCLSLSLSALKFVFHSSPSLDHGRWWRTYFVINTFSVVVFWEGGGGGCYAVWVAVYFKT